MAMNAGNAGCTTGLSKRVFDYWTADADNGFVSPLTGAALLMVKAQCYAFARAVVDEVAANAAASVVVSVGGLQRTPNPNNAATATDAPAAPVTLTGTVS